ncbi:hypothetical protein NLJ89_g11885 [Agrocybe chaxingu]|uniref:Uncharacterized protein n=1 Tax=Agrocybe chaxingu TaxID=84603 RepID=A0A9W8JP86_9AGAR|nr:hypothetical protein NLJ89_g11885 [Agrocybe chaxingu]
MTMDFSRLPQPRFNAKHLNLQILRNPSRWMKAYFFLWPLLVFYHLPLQSFFDFNAVYILLQVARFPNPQSSGKNWALGAAAYIACWLAWIFAVCIMYELVYSFARRWRLRRPLILPIYLSSSAFNLAALTSYNTFSFLQHLRFSAFFPEYARALSPLSPSDPDYSFADEQDQDYYGQESSWKQGLAETCFFYSQNLPTVALLLPRAGLCLALLFAFGSAPEVLSVFGVTTSGAGNLARRDATFFRPDAWRSLVLLASWLGLWIFSNQRLAGLCGPRHTWEESEQEKTRSVYSEAASEYGAYRGSVYPTGAAVYNSGDGEAASYRGDELAWEWRETTRMRVQDAFEFCLNTRRRSSSGGASTLRWAPAATPAGYNYGSRRYRHRRRKSSKAKGKEPSTEHENEKVAGTGEPEQFEGIERVLAAVGFPGAAAASPSRRAPLSKDLFSAPEGLAKEPIDPIQYEQIQPGPSSGMYTGLDAPKMAKRNSKDKIPGSSTAPYPFSSPGKDVE